MHRHRLIESQILGVLSHFKDTWILKDTKRLKDSRFSKTNCFSFLVPISTYTNHIFINKCKSNQRICNEANELSFVCFLTTNCSNLNVSMVT